ncbi:hypothetical protein C0J52_02380 [Blattella germanica]|nr:hypothetical protein C0J52_02380 [Blattella germanica]
MEDDDSDISMTIDESVSNEKTTASHLASVNVKSEVVSRHVSSPKLETDIKSDNEDINKSVDKQDKDFPPNNKNSENNIDMVISESDVPNSPKKVNGEVRSLECESGEQQSDVEINVKSAAVDRVRLSEDEDKDTNFEPDNTKTSSKCKQISALSSEIKEVKESSQNIENNTEYKGFKKKIIAQTSVASNNNSQNVPSKQGASLRSSKSVKVKKTSKKIVSAKPQHVLVSHQPLPDGTQSSAQLTEYAQYLGLQPTVKFKCYNCSESGFPTMPKLQEHQNICLKNVNKVQPIVKPTPPPTIPEPYPSTNFRITRKVYLCSACGTYYENWNLFLHMREVHRRHICLFCLGMFSQADKLASHLSVKHGVIEAAYTSEDHFVGENKGSFFLMCCTCERIFSERENFYDHSCSEGLIINAERACSLCGLRGAHFPTCRRAFTDSNASPPSCSTLPAPIENPPEPIQNSQHGVQERNATVAKYLVPVSKPPGKKVNKGNTVQQTLGDSQEKSRDLSDIEDDYDISNAASFCHVNIHEPQEKQNAVNATKAKVYKRKNIDGAGKKTSIEAKPTESSPTASKQSENIENCVESSGEKDESEINTSITIEKNSEVNNKIVEEKEKEKEEEEEEKVEKNETELQNDNENNVHSIPREPEAEKMDVDDQIEPEKCSSPEVPAKEETELHLESETKKQSEERSTPEKSKPAETNETLVPKTVASPKLLSETEAKPASKTQSATEAESESDTSDSGDESDSSSSSEVSSEESDHHDEEKTEDKMEEESDADNADSDKMSLVVDENRSEDETEFQSEKATQEEGVVDGNRTDEETELQPEKPTREEEEAGDDVEEEDEEEEERDESELKINEDETVKEDGKVVGEGEEDEKSDVEVVDNVVDDAEENKSADEEKSEEPGESIQLAGDDVPLLELTLEENLDTMNIQLLLKESVKVSCLNCVYCNHAKKIAVNGKQLALHLLAEHRFAPVVCSDSGELTEADGFIDKLKSSLSDLQQMFFNTDSYDNMDQSCMRPYDRTYECFHCHFLTTLHKELYVHNRKMHQKTILLCIMCKSNFYSYSELLCHMCPGIYVPESNINFRCCLCTVDGLPSAFRLMVHLRKRHHACDVCLETNGDQQKLSNHVWKHKLHHLCYRCGIAYRNKPDITKHLFWKHGTESVLCKKCLQKKWPHVYHFCIPPNAFVCEECNSSFSRAVALKVHKRLHAGDLPYQCDECEERFISRKLLVKHQQKHSEPTMDVTEGNRQENGPSGEIENHEDDEEDEKLNAENESHQLADKVIPEVAAGNSDLIKDAEQERTKDSVPVTPATQVKDEVDMVTSVAKNSGEGSKLEEKDKSEKKSKVLDVYDLPPLNLSSDSDDSDEDGEIKVGAKSIKPATEKDIVSGGGEGAKLNSEKEVVENLPPPEEKEETQQPIQVIDGIWENFKTYKANLEKRENKPTDAEDILNKKTDTAESTSNSKCLENIVTVIHMDHDYCGPPAESSQSATMEEIAEKNMTQLEDMRHTSSLHDGEKTEDAKDKTDDELKACDADHNYCYTNTSEKEEKEKESTSEYPVAVVSPSKKKQKSPKKKQKRSASSSSSDSSSNSDSSSCSCGTNCSCSSSSSSSSGSSSSQSSDSDSSSSEGRRRQAARRERRRERAKKRKIEETEEAVHPPPQLSTPPQSPKIDPVETATNGTPGQEEASAIPSFVEPEDVELPVRESDLDTDETETDEDFYDKYPQNLANKLLAEKRNQLLLLAAVAPVNNGTMSQSCQSPPRSPVVEEPVPKKKQKTKKHRKSQHQHISAENKMESKIKLNIPTDYYSSQSPAYSKATVPSSSTNNFINTTSLATPTRSEQSPFLSNHPESSMPTATYQNTGSGSETESKRLSKRKRVPKRFYGDSSDEEHEQQPPVKWRKISVVSSQSPAPQAQTVPAFTYKSTPISVPEQFHNPSTPVPENEEKSEDEEDDEDDEEEAEAAEDSDSDLEDTKKSSSDSFKVESQVNTCDRCWTL